MKRPIAGFLVLWAAWALPARADVQAISGDGFVHRVEVMTWTGSGRGTGTALRHSWQTPDGTRHSVTVPGTDDDVVDRQPAIDVDPHTNAVVLVWSRTEPAGSRIFWSRFEAGRWLPAAPLHASLTVDAITPDVRVGSNLTHVIWRETSGPPTVVKRASFERRTMSLTYGPEVLDANDAPFADASGSAVSNSWTPDDAFFALTIPGLLVGGTGRVVVWGVRDEPVPVGMKASFFLTVESSAVSDVSAQAIGDRVALWYVTTDRLVYATCTVDGPWSDQSAVNLSATLSSSEAKLRVAQMILRAGKATP